MRILLQTLSLLVIVWLGWEQPYRDIAARIFPWAEIAPSRLSLIKDHKAAPLELEETPAAPRRPLESTSPLNKPPKP